jgi:hypothetical protein
MKHILSTLAALVLSLTAQAQTTPGTTPTTRPANTVPPPPDKVPQPDGTIQLVPVPPGFVYTPYFIDPTIKYRVFLQSGWAQKAWNGGIKNGQYGYKGEIISADILAMPLTPPPLDLIVRGNPMKVTKWSVYRAADIVVQYDHTRLELLPLGANGPAFDGSVMDASKTKYTVLGDGLILYHAEALKAPELRTPPLKPQYYQWNFDGYLWQGAYRLLGKLQFRVKDDYYLPTWGSQKAFVRILPFTMHQGATITSKVDGSPVVGANVLGDIRSEGEDIQFGVPPTYKVAHYLTAPTSKFKAGDTIPVKIMVKPETKPQLIVSVATNLIWDNTVLELVSINKTGAPPSMENGFPLVGATAINEVALPKDGNAMHNWLCQLGNKTYTDKETMIVTLNFKVLNDFSTTKIDIAKKNDPRLAGLWVSEESQPLGSSIPGSSVLGAQSGVTVNGVLIP